jgi:prohibitin 2
VYSSDLQTVKLNLSILVKVPDASAIPLLKEYGGNPYESLLFPRIHEALKEITSAKTAEQLVKGREAIKHATLESARTKLGTILSISDIVIDDINLSDQLEKAIEEKMVQEQAAARARFTQQQAQVDADTAVIRAEGEAKAIRVQGQALKETPDLIRLKIVEKWDGKTPLVVGAGEGTNVLLPIEQPTKK